MRKLTTRFGVRILQIVCLLALAMSIFSGVVVAEASEFMDTSSRGHDGAQLQAVGSHQTNFAASEISRSCSIDVDEACEHAGEHDHLGGACGATHCLTGTLPNHGLDVNASVSQRFAPVLISVLPSGKSFNPHRPPNS